MKANLVNTIELCIHRQDVGRVPTYLSLIHDQNYNPIRDAVNDYLHHDEIREFQKILIPRRKHSFLLGRTALKLAIAAYYQEKAYPSYKVTKAILQYPMLQHERPDVPDIGLTHSGVWTAGLATRAGHVMGIDIEEQKPARMRAFERVLSPIEHEMVNVAGEGREEIKSLCTFWTLKEALSKAVRCGFTVPFNILEVKQLKKIDKDIYEANFSNFSQYKGYAITSGKWNLAIVLPKKSSIQLDENFLNIKKFLAD